MTVVGVSRRMPNERPESGLETGDRINTGEGLVVPKGRENHVGLLRRQMLVEIAKVVGSRL